MMNRKQLYTNQTSSGGWSDSSVGTSSASQSGDPGSNPSWLRSPNACMRGEEIASCKSHIPSVSLTNWCIMI